MPAAGRPRLDIRLLGGLEVRTDSATLPPFESARTESLLAYLLLHRGVPQPRQRIAFLFWPDSSEAQARTNLRHVLHNLRRALPSAELFLDVGHRTVAWRVDAPFRLDVAEFEAALAAPTGANGGEDGERLRRAVELYRGDLLEGSYEEWLSEHRDRLRAKYSEALASLILLLERRGEHARALPYSERLLRMDPLREESYRRLMKLHAACGDRARALRVYHECAATLERELGVEPSRGTRELYESLLPDEGDAAVEAPAARMPGPGLVGRTPEWTRLLGLWHVARAGGARLVLVTGEAGAGKTRLVEELRDVCAREGAATAEARAYAAEGALAYAPILAWLRSDALEPHWRRVDPRHGAELARLLPELADAPDARQSTGEPGADRTLRLFEALTNAILRSRGPLLLLADDLQWWDPESLRFVHFLLRSRPDAPLLVAATAREEEVAAAAGAVRELVSGLRALDLVREIQLDRLSRVETAQLAERSGFPLPAADLDRLFEETEGNPLFVIETLRGGWTASDRRAFTPRMKAVLDWRLDQLSPGARDLVGVASTIGREFTSELLAEASAADDDAFVGALDELWRRRIIRERDAESYDFSHDKLREACYLGLSPGKRRQHHLRVARALERVHAGDPAPWSAQIASHFDRSGAPRDALRWYPRAAGEAMRVHAHGESARLLERALELLRATPPSRERDEQELALLLALMTPLSTVEGHSSPELAEVQRRAVELGGTLGAETAPELLRSMALTNLSRDRFEEAQAVAQQLQVRGERDDDDGVLVESHYLLGISAFWRGQLPAARRHFEAAVTRYAQEQRAKHIARYGLDPQVICLSRLANTLWFLGRPRAAVRARDDALALGLAVGHPQSLGIQMVFAGLLSLELQDVGGVRDSVEALRKWCREYEYRAISVTTEAMLGYVEVLDGRSADGLARIQGALLASRGAQHAPGFYASLQRLLLAACEAARDPEAGAAAADLPPEHGAGTRLWAAESLRQRASFRAALGAGSDEIEADLREALDVARRQGARSLEVRVSATLLRHRMERSHRSKVAEARDLLSASLDRLPERWEGPELRAVEALLQE